MLEPFIDGLAWKKLHPELLESLLEDYKKEGRESVDIEIRPEMEEELLAALKGWKTEQVGTLRMGKSKEEMGPETLFIRVMLV